MTTVEQEGAAQDSSAAPAPAVFASSARRIFGSLSSEEARQALQIRPPRVASVRRPGREPYHVLMFGSGALEALGLPHHDSGLPGRVADEVVRMTSRGVQVDVVVVPDPTTQEAIAGLGGLRLRRYDSIVVVLGDHAASGQHASSVWRGALVGLVRVLLSDASPEAALFLWDSAVAVSSIGRDGRRGGPPPARLRAITEEVCAVTGRVRFGELDPPLNWSPAVRFSDATYQAWAELMVTKLVPRLKVLDANRDSDTPHAYRNAPADERLRQRALSCVGLVPGRRDERLESEVRAVKRMFGVGRAAFTVVDGEWTWTKACTEMYGRQPRAQTICDWAIRRDGLTLLNDLWLDARTRKLELVQLGMLRFYAGYPIHSWDGYRLGMLCLYDAARRDFSPWDLEGLRDAAGRIEQLIWSESLRRHKV